MLSASRAQSGGEPRPGGTSAEVADKLESFCIIPESYRERPPVFVLAPGARDVGFTVVRETPHGLVHFARDEWRALRRSWDKCLQQGREAATRQLDELEPTFVRDENEVIQFARFQSEDPLTCSIILSPEFPALLADTLGKDLYVAVPDRFNVFVFSKLSPAIEAAAPKMNYLFKEALFPVTREVFEINENGIRVAGKF